MGRDINLDKARQARAEKRPNEAPTVTFKDTKFELPLEMPFAFVEAVYLIQTEDQGAVAQSGILTEMAQALFGERYSEFRKLYPSVPDFEELMEQVAEAYSASLGESAASEG